MSDFKKSSFEEELKRCGRLIYSNEGDSMMPLIRQGRDLLVIERPKEWEGLPQDSLTSKLKKYDVPLYKRDHGNKYVLHRVLEVREQDYVICGDNRRHREYGISDRHVIGVLTAVIRGGKEIPLTSFGYRIYVHLWCDLFWVRAGIICFRDLTGRIKRKLRKPKNRG